MRQVLSRAGRALWLGGPLLVLLAVPLGCSEGNSLVSSESPLPPADSMPPPDTTTPPPPDTTTPPAPDTTTPPPPDTTTPPPPDTPGNPASDCGPNPGSSGAPQHEGIPFGPAQLPPSEFSTQWSGTVYTANPICIATHLARARSVNAQLVVSFTGNEEHNRDENGFSMTKWKQRVDRFRNVNLNSYVEDGTIVAHFLLDEPSDPSNWNGKVVSKEQIDEMARYSKEIWPTLPTMIRAWPDYLQGFQYKHLDAIRFHYLETRHGPLDAFLQKNMSASRAMGLAIVGGLNVLNGGSKNSGIPGRADNRYAMSAGELRAWGTRFLNEPGMCAFILWEHDEKYLARSDIKAALEELVVKARSYPKQRCRR